MPSFLLSNPLIGAAIGGLIGFIMVIPALIIEHRDNKDKFDMPILMDVKPRFGKNLNHRELVLMSLFIHLVLTSLFGLLYPVFVEQGWLFITHSPYTLLSLFAYAIGAWLVVGLIIFPAVGFGLFGKKEDNWVWLEILVTQLILGVGLWLVVQWYQPSFFV